MFGNVGVGNVGTNATFYCSRLKGFSVVWALRVNHVDFSTTMVTLLDVWACIALHWGAEHRPPSFVGSSRCQDWFVCVVFAVRLRAAHRLLVAELPTAVVWSQTKAWYNRVIRFKITNRDRFDVHYDTELSNLVHNGGKYIRIVAGVVKSGGPAEEDHAHG